MKSTVFQLLKNQHPELTNILNDLIAYCNKYPGDAGIYINKFFQENRNKYSEQHVLNAFTCFLGCGKLKQSYTVFYIDKTIDVYWDSPSDIPATFEINGTQHNRDDGAIVPILFEVVKDPADISVFDKIRIATNIINEIDSVCGDYYIDGQKDDFKLNSLEYMVLKTEPIWQYLADYSFKDNQPPNCGQGMAVLGDKLRRLALRANDLFKEIKDFLISNKKDITNITSVCDIVYNFSDWAEGFPKIDSAQRSLRLKEISLEPLEPFKDFKNLKDGWIEGGKAIDPQHIDNVYNLFDQNYRWERGFPRPRFYPTPDGGIQAEWSLGGYEVSLEFEPQETDHLIGCFDVSDPNNNYENRILNFDGVSSDWNWLLDRINILNKVDSAIIDINFLQKGISS